MPTVVEVSPALGFVPGTMLVIYLHFPPLSTPISIRRENLPTTTLYPTKDAEGNPLETEYGLCRFKDHQTVTIQVRDT